MLMNSDGLLIKIAASAISLIGRTTQGVHLMKLQDGQSVRSMTVIERSSDGRARPTRPSW